MSDDTSEGAGADVRARLLAAAADWKGRSRPPKDNDKGEVCVQRIYGESWRVYGCCLDLAPVLEQIADRWPDKVESISHDPGHGTTVIVAQEVYSLTSGVRRRVSEEERAAASARAMANFHGGGHA